MGQTPDSTEPKKRRPIVGRAAIKLSPIKEWSGGLSEHEVEAWEAIADEIRTGTPPSVACGAMERLGSWAHHRRHKTSLYYYLLAAWDEGTKANLAKVKRAESWQAAAWLLERTKPEMFAVDSAIRNQLNMMAGEAGFPVPDLMDAVRIIREAQDSGIDVHAVLKQAIEAQAG